MKKKIFLLFIILSTFLFMSINSIKAKQNYEINIDYEKSEYKLLDQEINKKINIYIKSFKDTLDDINTITYTLHITHEKFTYKNYISYVFHIESYTGGAHPNHEIFTVNYDKYNNTIIDIDTLVNKYPNILNTFSKISRNKLLYNKNIVDTNMMLEGTKPTKENFSNFAFSKDGIILFFEYYQVAPYSSGEFKVILPYSCLK